MTSNTNGPEWNSWIEVVDHVGALIGFVAGSLVTAGLGLWRAAVWTERINAQIAKNRDASDARHEAAEEASKIRHEAILARLEAISVESEKAHEGVRREVDNLRQDVRADREETRAMRTESREASAALSARIDGVMAHRRA